MNSIEALYLILIFCCIFFWLYKIAQKQLRIFPVNSLISLLRNFVSTAFFLAVATIGCTIILEIPVFLFTNSDPGTAAAAGAVILFFVLFYTLALAVYFLYLLLRYLRKTS